MKSGSLWEITEQMLVSLASCSDDFDTVLVDDKSQLVDIPARAESLGIRVLDFEGTAPMGVTHAWNLVWAFFMAHEQYEGEATSG